MADEALPPVSLDVHLDREPVEGDLRRADGSLIHFSGWIELAAVLESERAATGPAALPEAPPAS